MTNDITPLLYLASRLRAIGKGRCLEAADLVQRATAMDGMIELNPEAEHALCHAVWDHLSKALDIEDFDSEDFNEVTALQSEMAGRVLFYRLAKGWLIRSADSPEEFASIESFMQRYKIVS